jgi:hypothetical protein
MERCRVDSVASVLGPEVGSCEHGDGTSGSGATELVTQYIHCCPP